MLKETLELILGVIFLLLSLMLIVLISNKVCKVIDNEHIHRIFILVIHLILIASMIVFLIKIMKHYIVNDNIYKGILVLAGPIIGATSNYIVPIIKDLIKSL